jgi:DNA-binding transcriptional LysR family regulator
MPREHQFPFELRHLVYFNEVAKTLHFKRAAQALVLTQPSLSRQIRQMEESLGVQLLERHSRKVELTAEGRFLAQKCAGLFPQMHEIVTEVREMAKGREGVLRIMFTSLAMANSLPAILSAFAQSSPKVRIDLTEAGTEAQLSAIGSGQADCGFCHPEALPRGLTAKTVNSEIMGIVLPSGHWLSKKEVIAPRDLQHEEFVLFPAWENPLLYRRMLKYWKSCGFGIRVRQELPTRVNRAALAAAGMGVTYACPSEAPLLPRETVFRPLKDGRFSIKTAAVWIEKNMSHPLKQFTSLIQTCQTK